MNNNSYNSEDSSSHKRIERIFFLYRNYLFIESLNDSQEEIESNYFEFNKKQKDFIQLILKNINDLENKLKKLIPDDWKIERFNFLERAILLNGSAEIIFKKKNKKIVINESIEFARKYCTEKSPSLINAVLDKIG